MSRVLKGLRRTAAFLLALVFVLGLMTGFTILQSEVVSSVFSAWLTVEEQASYTRTVTTVETKRADELE